MGTTWHQQELPDLAGAADPVWRWQLASPGQLTAARCELRAQLAESSLPPGTGDDDIARLLLAFEELASNGLRHGGAPVQVTVHATPHGWLVDVSDSRTGRPPTPAVDRDPAEGGMGLHLVSHLSVRCGWSLRGREKHVWACITPRGEHG